MEENCVRQTLCVPNVQVILATDADTAGANLAAELSRRLKRHRCKITAWPSGWQDHLLYMDMDAVSQRLRDFEAVRTPLLYTILVQMIRHRDA